MEKQGKVKRIQSVHYLFSCALRPAPLSFDKLPTRIRIMAGNNFTCRHAVLLLLLGAPPDLMPDLSRSEVAIGSNLIIDDKGKIRFLDLLNTAGFDARLTKLKALLDKLLTGE